MTGKKYLTVTQLKHTRSCKKFGELASMHLSSAPVPEFDRNERIKNVLVGSLKDYDSAEKAMATWNEFFEKEYALLPGAVSKEAGEMLRQKGERFISWFYDRGYTVRGTGFRYVFPYKDILVKGESDLCLERRDGSLLYMDIRFGKNPYSYGARKSENNPEHAIELLSRMTTACYEGADCCIAFLTSKKDKSAEIVPKFEQGKGFNVAILHSCRNALETLENVMGYECKEDCKACSIRKMCIAKPFEDWELETEEVKKTLKKMSKATDAQQMVISHREGPLVCMAIPGAGKTRVLVERMVSMIKEGKAAEKFLFATFTKKACKEIRGRISGLVTKDHVPTIGTFHSIAYQILEEYGPEDVLKKIATETIKMRLIEEAVKKVPVIRGFSYEYQLLSDYGLYRTLLAQFDKIREMGEEKYAYEGDRNGILLAYAEYKKAYEDGGYYEYDDLITKAVEVLKDPNILREYQNRWDWYMFDEFQDVSKEQAEFVMLLAGKNRNIVVVGDDDQAIYAWRKGTDHYLRYFTKYYPDAKIVFMEDNFRTTASILRSAESLIRHNEGRYQKHLKTANEEGQPPYYAKGLSDRELIELLKGETRFDPSEICIIGRDNAGLEALAAVMEKKGLHSTGPRNFIIDSKEFGVLKCFLNFAKNRTEVPGQDLYRLMKYIGADIPEEAGKLYDLFSCDEKLPDPVSGGLAELEINEKLSDQIKGAFRTLTDIEEVTPGLDAIIDRIEEEGCATWADVLTLMDEMEAYKDSAEIEYHVRRGFYNLMTAHKAKGKEFPFVVIYNVLKFTDDKECRNLLYVSMTRAEKMLLIEQDEAEKEAPLISEITGMEDIEKYFERRRAEDAVCNKGIRRISS